MRVVQRVVLPLLLVAVVTVVALAFDASRTPAALLLLSAVVGSAMLSRWAGLVSAVSSIVVLQFWWVPPRGGFLLLLDRRELLVLSTYVLAALAVNWLVARLAELRRVAEQGEREARIRLDLNRRLLTGEAPSAVVRSTAASLVGLFGLASCKLRIGDLGVRVDGHGPRGRTERIVIGPAEVVAVLPAGRRPLTEGDRAVIEALAAGVAASVELVRVDAEAKRARSLAEARRTRARVLSAVSHNLRTPLSAIRAAAELLEGGGLGASTQATLLGTIREEALRLERFVTNTLDLGRLRAGGLVPERRPVDVTEIVQAAVHRLEPLANGQLIEVAVDPDLPELHIDVSMIEQALGNLLENALRFAPEGSGILIAASQSDSAVEVRVADHGPGVAEADKTRMFEEFARGSGQHDDASGVGLGLAIVRSMVEVHGGAVWYEQTPGGGATFALRLPLEARV